MKKYVLMASLLALTGCGGASESYKSCVEKGEAYFKEIESWPHLSDGRNAMKVIVDRCQRNDGAFDGLD
ncbi:hypothetical protein [Brevundimonas sp.]|uniref:hypothetical protein n=1 Tax=Brevundimonas sp. TaxID=1871086 RepID=UPI002FC797FB